MKSLVIVCAFNPQPLWQKHLLNRPLEEWLSEALKQCFDNSFETLWLGLEAQKDLIPATWLKLHSWFFLPEANALTLIQTVRTVSKDYEKIAWIQADQPFLQSDLVRKTQDLFTQYHAEYAFSEGYPEGLAPQFIHPRILPILEGLVQRNEKAMMEKGIFDSQFWFNLLALDINAFDIETLVAEEDFRSLRLNFRADTERNFLLLERFAADAAKGLRAFLEALKNKEDQLRTLPAVLQIQIVEGAIQVPSWSPQLQFQPEILSTRRLLDPKVFQNWVQDFLSLAGDLTVMPGFWCEPSLHPEFEPMMAGILDLPGLSVAVETSGLGWGMQRLQKIAETLGNRIDWIVEIDSNLPENYLKIRGNGFQEAQDILHGMVELFPGRVWPQTVRMKSNEEEMESFYRYWKEKAGQIILQKHNYYSGRLSEEKPADLSPWKRFPCWHIKRDLGIFQDGTVVPCRDAWKKELILGNLNQNSCQQIWTAGQEFYQAHISQNYPEICRKCDEYYTFYF